MPCSLDPGSHAGTTLIMGVVGYSRRTFETWYAPSPCPLLAVASLM
jgi:hypothetical protein